MPRVFRYTFSLMISLYLFTYSQAQKTQLGSCDTILTSSTNKPNYKKKIELLKSCVFDTTATLLNCHIVDAKSSRPLVGARIQLSNKSRSILKKSNDRGEFEIFTNLEPGEWNLEVDMPGYVCLYVVNIVQQGGQWYKIMLNHK